MRIQYHVTGAERKSLVAAISQFLDAPLEYLGAPTFAFKVGGYHIDKNGTVTGKDNLELEDALYQKGFSSIEREYDEPDTYESGLGVLADEPSIRESDILTIEMPLDGFTDESLANLEKLIASKANLIKKAIGIDELPIVQTDETLQFPWFPYNSSVEEITAYARFIGALCNAAKQQKRVTAREKMVENEKFAFRVFLIRLGFVGEEFKNIRKLLLRNLDGNSAYSNGGPKKATNSSETEVSHE